MRRVFSGVCLFLLMIQPSTSFFFGRSDLVAPIDNGVPSAVAVINGAKLQAVVFHQYNSRINEGGGSMTVAAQFTDFSTDTESFFISRQVPGLGSLLVSTVIVDPDDRSLVWAITETRLIGISLTNGTIMSASELGSHFSGANGWLLGTHTSGSRFAVLIVSRDEVCWTLPNATQVCVHLPVSAYHLLGGTNLYVLSMLPRQNSGSATNASLINLEDGTVITMTPFQPPDVVKYTALSACSFELNSGASIAFLCQGNETISTLFILNTTSLALSVSTLASVNETLASWDFDDVHCAATAMPGEYLVWYTYWETFDTRVGDRLFILNPKNASLLPYTLPGSLGIWTSIDVSPQGDVLASSCTWDPMSAEDCALLWYTQLTSATAAVGAAVGIGGAPSEYRLAAQPREDIGIIMMDSNYAGVCLGFVVVNMLPSPTVVTWIGLNSEERFDMSFGVDPETMVIYFASPNRVKEVWAHSFDWFVPSSIDVMGIRYQLHDGGFSSHTPYSLLAAGGSLYIGSIQAWGPVASVVVRYDFSSGLAQRLSNVTLPSAVRALARGVNDTVIATGMEEAYVLSMADLGTQQLWPYQLGGIYWEVLDVALTAENVIYTLLFDYDEVAVGSILASAPNGTRIPFSVANVSSDWMTGKLSIGNGFLYAGAWFSTGAHVLTFSLANGTLLNVFDTAIPSMSYSNPILTVADMIYFGRAPDLTPVYLDCGLGAFRNFSSGVCSACPNGSVNAQADTQACMPCPTRTQPDVAMTLCVCGAGFYSTANDANCDACPEGGVCLGSNELIPAPGYWRAENSSSVFYACPFSTNACNGSDVCSTAYLGPLCAVCAPKHALVAGLCRRCSSFLASVGFWLLAGLVYLAIFLVLLIPGGLAAVSVLKSFISFAQIVSFPAKGPLPQLLANRFAYLARFLSLANFQVLSIVSPDCLLQRHLNFATTAVAEALLPMCFLLLILFITLVPWHRAFDKCFFRCKSSRSHSSEPFDETPGFADRFEAYKRTGTPLRVMLFIVLLATPSVTQQLASFFTCKEVASLSYLVHDYTVQCYHGLWTVFVAPVSLLLCLYAVGVPATLFTLLYRYRDTLDLRFLHSSYKDDYYWWDITEQLRKLSLLLVNAVLAPRAPSYYGPTALAICFVSIAAHMQVQPYKNARDMWFQTADLAGVTLYFLWSVSADSAEDTTAWLYWLFAVGYTLASMGVMLWPLLGKVIACVHCCGRNSLSAERESELDPLVPSKK